MVKKLAVLDENKCIGCMECMFACSRRVGRGGMNKSAIGVRSAGGIERGFVITACRACKNPPCAKVCPTDALREREGGGIILDEDKCIGCGYCVDACILGAIFWDTEKNKPLVCKYCGKCAEYCVHDVIGLVDVEES